MKYIKSIGKTVLLWWAAFFIAVFISALDGLTMTLILIGVLFSIVFILFCKLVLTENDLMEYSGWNLMCRLLHIDNTLDDE